MKGFITLKNLLIRPKKEIAYVLQSLLYILQIRRKLDKKGFNRLAEKYQLKQGKEKATATAYFETAKQIGWAVERSSLLFPWDDLCLVKALTAQRLLQKNGLSATLYMGTKIDPENGNLKAHAWLTYKDIFLTGRAGHKEYKVILIYTWDCAESFS